MRHFREKNNAKKAKIMRKNTKISRKNGVDLKDLNVRGRTEIQKDSWRNQILFIKHLLKEEKRKI